jgi:hypothetical protein
VKNRRADRTECGVALSGIRQEEEGVVLLDMDDAQVSTTIGTERAKLCPSCYI